MIKSLKNQLPKQDILQELDPRKPRMALGTRTTAHNRGYGEQAGGGGRGKRSQASPWQVTPLCRCRASLTSESAIGHERKPTQRP